MSVITGFSPNSRTRRRTSIHCKSKPATSIAVMSPSFTLRSIVCYRGMRENANRSDIKITTTPVTKTNRSASRRRIGNPLDKAVPLGMVLRHRHVHFAEGPFYCVHHQGGPADEVLVVRIRQRQVALEHRSVNEAPLARPAGTADSPSTWTIVRLSRSFSDTNSSRKVMDSQSLLP